MAYIRRLSSSHGPLAVLGSWVHRGSLAAFALLLPSFAAHAAPIPLDATNWLGPSGSRYWRITVPGSYYLNVAGSTFNSDSEYVVRIEVGGVTLDGMGKAISGSAPPAGTAPGTPNLYGVRVNGGVDIANVRVTNLRVTNKYFGIIFEAVGSGQIDHVVATGNRHGLYYWRTHYTTLQSNVASGNLISGIQCDGNVVPSTYNTIVDNTTDGNVNSGIWLWDQCLYHTVRANRSRANGQMGIALSVGANSSTLAFNLLEGNSTGIWVESNSNSIDSNVAEANANVGVLLKQASSNTVASNTIARNQNAGIWLDQATATTIRANTIARNLNWGVFHANGSSAGSIFDNYFSNTNNAGFSVSGSNSWSAPLSPGTNSVGGPYMGGNYWATPNHTGFSETAADADRNGIADAQFAPGIGNNDAFPLHATARVRPSSSFDANTRADLLWRKTSTGENAIWFMNGASVAAQFIAPAEPGWTITGRESFDGDGQADILWRHADGRNAIWFMDGAVAKSTSGYIPPVADSNWKIVATGDFDGDGYADILWRHAASGQHVVWFMRRLEVRWTATLPAVDTNWRAAGTGDFDGDGKDEILWRHSVTGQNALWSFESYDSFQGVLIGSAGLGWSVAGTGDFNGDGNADILWRDGSGQNAIWFQNGVTTTSAAFLSPAAAEWSVVSVGDVNGDGKSDIVWRNTSNVTALWLMNGASVTSSAILGNTPGWTLVK